MYKYPKYLINDILDTSLDLSSLKKKLYLNKILMKDYESDNLLLLYTNYNTNITKELEKECRSLLIDRITYKIVAYSCEFSHLDIKNLNFLSDKYIITQCYEGSYLTVFNYNNKWHVSSRKYLNISLHCELFYDTICDKFYEYLDKDKIYNFILIHHKDKHIIDYTLKFGNNYKKLSLTCIRDTNLVELDLELNNLINCDYIFLPDKLSNQIQNLEDINEDITEGIIIKIWNNDMNKYNLIKIQNETYKYNSLVKNNQIYGMIYLYAKHKIDKNSKIGKYNSIGLLNLVFKTFSKNIYNLFFSIYNEVSGKKIENSIYNTLIKEFKELLYNIKGLYFIKKNNKLKLLENDIYIYLKNIESIKLIKLLQESKKYDIFKSNDYLYNLLINLI